MARWGTILAGKLRKRRQGMSMVEAILLIIVLMLSIAGIMSSMLWSADLVTFSRTDLGARAWVFSLFEMLDSVPSDKLKGDFDNEVKKTIASLGGSGNMLGGYRITATVRSSPSDDNGVLKVEVLVDEPVNLRKMTPFRLERYINTVSSETVSDDRRAGE